MTILSTIVAHRLRSFWLMSSTDYSPTILRRPLTTVLPTYVAHRLWSFGPPSPDNDLYDIRHPSTMVLPAYVAHRLQSFKPPSPEKDLYDLRRPPTTILLTYVTHRLQFFRPPSLIGYGSRSSDWQRAVAGMLVVGAGQQLAAAPPTIFYHAFVHDPNTNYIHDKLGDSWGVGNFNNGLYSVLQEDIDLNIVQFDNEVLCSFLLLSCLVLLLVGLFLIVWAGSLFWGPCLGLLVLLVFWLGSYELLLLLICGWVLLGLDLFLVGCPVVVGLAIWLVVPSWLLSGFGSGYSTPVMTERKKAVLAETSHKQSNHYALKDNIDLEILVDPLATSGRLKLSQQDMVEIASPVILVEGNAIVFSGVKLEVVGGQSKNLYIEIDLSGLDVTSFNEKIWAKARSKIAEALEIYGGFEVIYNEVNLDLRNDLLGVAVPELFTMPGASNLIDSKELPYHGAFFSKPGFPFWALQLTNPNTLAPIQEYAKVIWPQRNDFFWLANYYKGNKIALPPHKDPNYISIVCQHNIEGLEVENKSTDEWIETKPSKNSFTVLVGEAFKAWTNGRLHASNHRVKLKNETEKRYAVIFGTVPILTNDMINVREELVDEEHPLLFKPFKYYDYIKYRFTDGENLEDALKAYCGV
ncbi:Gibberellin 2-beta-dioxygenase 2 [Dendrobium catenatum]|uniref:Gibberellin 2-beta-dioxygenase 2 n=1 Tax=Dendrobium catenatum TaxID=906689 RepID=A0A2I0WGQ4_9ASPA|nr:Gibberellin 2-beta-dioxygenase 2 [Dendrobium catenatum]